MVHRGGEVHDIKRCAYRRNKILANCSTLSVRKYIAIPYSTSQLPKIRFAMCVEFVLVAGIARVSLEKRSDMMRMYSF